MHLDNGQVIIAQLVVRATGLNTSLSKQLGVTHQCLAERPTVTAGFDVFSPNASALSGPVLVYYGDNRETKLIWSMHRGKVWLRQRAEIMLRAAERAIVPQQTRGRLLLPDASGGALTVARR